MANGNAGHQNGGVVIPSFGLPCLAAEREAATDGLVLQFQAGMAAAGQDEFATEGSSDFGHIRADETDVPTGLQEAVTRLFATAGSEVAPASVDFLVPNLSGNDDTRDHVKVFHLLVEQEGESRNLFVKVLMDPEEWRRERENWKEIYPGQGAGLKDCCACGEEGTALARGLPRCVGLVEFTPQETAPAQDGPGTCGAVVMEHIPYAAPSGDFLEVVILAAQLSETIQEMHQRRKLAIRDIHPGNIRKRADGSYVLVDLGSVIKVGSSIEQGVSGVKETFAAPETLSKGDITEASDMYSFGRTLLSMLLGRDLPRVKDEEVGATFKSRLEKDGLPDSVRAGAPFSLTRKDCLNLLDFLVAGMVVAVPQRRQWPADTAYRDRVQAFFDSRVAVFQSTPAMFMGKQTRWLEALSARARAVFAGDFGQGCREAGDGGNEARYLAQVEEATGLISRVGTMVSAGTWEGCAEAITSMLDAVSGCGNGIFDSALNIHSQYCLHLAHARFRTNPEARTFLLSLDELKDMRLLTWQERTVQALRNNKDQVLAQVELRADHLPAE